MRAHIDEFIGRSPRRSVVVEVHEPVSASWSRNADTEHPAASLVKVPLVGALLVAMSEDETIAGIRVRPADLAATAYPTVRSAFAGSALTMPELAALAIVSSDNAAADLILEHLGPEPYERFLSDAGCLRTGTPPGFTDGCFDRLAEVRTTARDQISILGHVWSTDILRPLRRWMANNLYNSRLTARTEPPDVFAHKTGTLAGAVHDVGVLTTPRLRASVAVLASGEEDPVAVSYEMAELGRGLAAGLADMAEKAVMPAGTMNP